MSQRWLIIAASLLAVLCIIAALILFTRPRITPTPAPAIVEVVPPAVPAPSPEPTNSDDPVLDLFNPSQAALNEQLNDAALKNRLEDLVVLAFVLRRCNYLSPAEYNDSFTAYDRYAASSPGALDAAIASASASYSLLYAGSECNAAQLPASAAQLAQWRNAVLNPLTQ